MTRLWGDSDGFLIDEDGLVADDGCAPPPCLDCCGFPFNPTLYGVLDAWGGWPNYLVTPESPAGSCRLSGAGGAPLNYGRQWSVRVELDGTTTTDRPNPFDPAFDLRRSERVEIAFAVRCLRTTLNEMIPLGYPTSVDGVTAYAAARLGVPEASVQVRELREVRNGVLRATEGFFAVALDPDATGTRTASGTRQTGPDTFEPFDCEEPFFTPERTPLDVLGPLVYGSPSQLRLVEIRFPARTGAGGPDQLEAPTLNGGWLVANAMPLLAADWGRVGCPGWLGYPINAEFCGSGAPGGVPYFEFTQAERESIMACGGDHQCVGIFPDDPGAVSGGRSGVSVRTSLGPLVGAARWSSNALAYPIAGQSERRDTFTGLVRYAVDLERPCDEPAGSVDDPPGPAVFVPTDFIDPPDERDPDCDCPDPVSEEPGALLAAPCDPELEPIGYDPGLWAQRPEGAGLLLLEVPDPDGPGMVTRCFSPLLVPTELPITEGLAWTAAACDEEPCAEPLDPDGFRVATACRAGDPEQTIVVHLSGDPNPGGAGALYALRSHRRCYRVTDQAASGPATPVLYLFRSTPHACATDSRCVNTTDPEPPTPIEPVNPYDDQPRSNAPGPPGTGPRFNPTNDELIRAHQARGDCPTCGEGYR